MKKIYTNFFLLLFFAILTISSLNYSTGPGLNGQTVTGAPFNSNQTCTNCHGGGSFNATVTLALYSGVNPVTNYTPGAAYTVRLTRSGTGIPAAGGFGFQMTCATTPGNVNNNTWGAPPSGFANRLVLSRNYIEHTAKQNSATTIVNVPWTAPATNLGSMRFYVALNTVNGSSSTAGDQVVATTLTIPVNPLPITFLYFNGKNEKNKNQLEWATTNEVKSGYFTVEKSSDGENFLPIHNVIAISAQMDTKVYGFTDVNASGSPFYRVKYTSVSNEETFYKTIQIRSGGNPGGFHYVQGNNVVLQLSEMEAQRATLQLFDINGRQAGEKHLDLSNGNNTIGIDKPEVPGVYIISLLSQMDDIIYKNKVSVE